MGFYHGQHGRWYFNSAAVFMFGLLSCVMLAVAHSEEQPKQRFASSSLEQKAQPPVSRDVHQEFPGEEVDSIEHEVVELSVNEDPHHKDFSGVVNKRANTIFTPVRSRQTNVGHRLGIAPSRRQPNQLLTVQQPSINFGEALHNIFNKPRVPSVQQASNQTASALKKLLNLKNKFKRPGTKTRTTEGTSNSTTEGTPNSTTSQQSTTETMSSTPLTTETITTTPSTTSSTSASSTTATTIQQTATTYPTTSSTAGTTQSSSTTTSTTTQSTTNKPSISTTIATTEAHTTPPTTRTNAPSTTQGTTTSTTSSTTTSQRTTTSTTPTPNTSQQTTTDASTTITTTDTTTTTTSTQQTTTTTTTSTQEITTTTTLTSTQQTTTTTTTSTPQTTTTTTTSTQETTTTTTSTQETSTTTTTSTQQTTTTETTTPAEPSTPESTSEIYSTPPTYEATSPSTPDSEPTPQPPLSTDHANCPTRKISVTVTQLLPRVINHVIRTLLRTTSTVYVTSTIVKPVRHVVTMTHTKQPNPTYLRAHKQQRINGYSVVTKSVVRTVVVTTRTVVTVTDTVCRRITLREYWPTWSTVTTTITSTHRQRVPYAHVTTTRVSVVPATRIVPITVTVGVDSTLTGQRHTFTVTSERKFTVFTTAGVSDQARTVVQCQPPFTSSYG